MPAGPLALAAWLTLAGPAPSGGGDADQANVLTPTSTAMLRDAAAPYVPTGRVTDGWSWYGMQVDRARARYVMRGPDGEEATLTVLHPDARAEGDAPDLEGEAVLLFVEGASASGRAAARRLGERLIAADRLGQLDTIWRDPVQRSAVLPTLMRFALWPALALLLLWRAIVGARGTLTGESRRSAWAWFAALVGLALLAAALRIGFATYGPGDHQLNIATALEGQPDLHDREYGYAPAGLLHTVLLLAPASVVTLVATNVALSSLAPVFGALLTRALGMARWVAVFAGGVLALHPLLVRHGGEANRQPYVFTLGLVALWAMARLASADTRSARWGYGLLTLTAGALCLHSRPEAALLLALLPVPLLSPGPRLREMLAALRRARVDVTLAGLLLCGLLAASWAVVRVPHLLSVDVGQTVVAAREERFLGLLQTVWLDRAFTPAALLGLALLGFVIGALRRERLLLWLVPPLLAMSYVVAAYPLFGDHLCNARYHVLTLVPVTLAAAYAAGQLAELGGRLRPWLRTPIAAALAVAVLATTWGPLQHVTAPRTEDRELQFILETAKTLPDDATVVVVNHKDDAVLKLYTFIPRVTGTRQRWVAWHNAGTSDGPMFYYHAASCSSGRLGDAARAECAEGLTRFAAQPFAVTELGPLHSLAGERDETTVSVGFYVVPRG